MTGRGAERLVSCMGWIEGWMDRWEAGWMDLCFNGEGG